MPTSNVDGLPLLKVCDIVFDINIHIFFLPYCDCLIHILFIVLIAMGFNCANSFLFDSALASASGTYLVQREKLFNPSGKSSELQKAFPREAEV
jgi:hypothetical protein